MVFSWPAYRVSVDTIMPIKLWARELVRAVEQARKSKILGT
jgi:hypothetical protein